MANKDNSKDKNLICNFCGKSQDEVELLMIRRPLSSTIVPYTPRFPSVSR